MVRWLVAAVAAMAVMAPVARAATPGDNFAEALPLAGSLPIEIGGSNVGATKEIGAENASSFAAGHSVWFRWTAGSTGWVTVGACTATFPTTIGIFTGTELVKLTRVAQLSSEEGPHCPVQGREYTFWATGGSEYSIAVDGNAFYLPQAPRPATEGTFALRIEATPPPANDDFAAAAPVIGRSSEEPNGARFYIAPVSGYTWGATKGAGEPDLGGLSSGAAVWYSWTAPESGAARISACCAGAPIIGVFAGSSLGSLVRLASNRESGDVYWPVTAGATYMIAVNSLHDPESKIPAGGRFELQFGMFLARGPGQPKGDSPPQSTPAPKPPVAPRTILVKRSVDPDQRSATFVFKSSTPGSKYRCKLDRGRYKPCRSRKTYRHLTAGRHTVKVVTVDAAGSADLTPLVSRLSIPK